MRVIWPYFKQRRDGRLGVDMNMGAQDQDPKATNAKRDKLILVLEPDDSDRNRLGDWLEGAGYGVIECPGPRRQDFTCLGVRGERCRLVELADLAILDGRVLVVEAGSDSRAATRLLRYYLASDKPVLVLADRTGTDFSFEDDRVAVATRANSQSVLGAVGDLLDLDRFPA